MLECKSAPSPLPEGHILVMDMKSPYIDSGLYCRLVGKLIFFTITRLDLSYAVSRISNYMANPQAAYLEAAKHILHYLKGTLDQGILYKANFKVEILGYTNADWGSYPETRHSMGAYLPLLHGIRIPGLE
jgi:hypothetical protein